MKSGSTVWMERVLLVVVRHREAEGSDRLGVETRPLERWSNVRTLLH